MNINLLFILITFLSTQLYAQKKDRVLTLDTNIVLVGNLFIYPSTDVYDPLKVIEEYSDEELQEKEYSNRNYRIDTLTEKVYKKLKKKNKSTLDRDSSKVTWTDTSFTIKLKQTSQTYTCDRNYAHCDYYIGYLTPLQLYAIESISASNEVGIFLLVDRVSGKSVYLESNSDFPLSYPAVSKDTSLMSAYLFDAYSSESYVSLYRIEINEYQYVIKSYARFVFQKSEIEDLIWIDNLQFVVRLKNLYNENVTDILKVTLIP